MASDKDFYIFKLELTNRTAYVFEGTVNIKYDDYSPYSATDKLDLNDGVYRTFSYSSNCLYFYVTKDLEEEGMFKVTAYKLGS